MPEIVWTGKIVCQTSSRQRKLYAKIIPDKETLFERIFLAKDRVFPDNETHMSYVIWKLTCQNFFRTKKLIS